MSIKGTILDIKQFKNIKGGSMFSTTPNFSSFSVTNREEAQTFYQDVLGLTVEGRPEGLNVQLFGGGRVFLYQKDDHMPASFTVLNFVVEDIDTTVAELAAKGVSFEHYDTDMLKTDEKGIARGRAAGHGPDIAWFKDPAGNVLSVIAE